MKRLGNLVLFILTTVGLAAFAQAQFHFVKKGETLSEIARKYIGPSVYKPKNGSLAKILELNPQIRNPNLIFPGERIQVLPAPLRETASAAPAKPAASLLLEPKLKPVDLQPQQIFWAWVGLGATYTEYSQSLQDNSTNYGGFKSPSISVSGGSMFSPQWGLDLSYSEKPGQIASNDSITVKGSDFKWSTFSAQALYLPRRESRWTYLLGFQQQEFPFLLPTATNEVQVYQNEFTTLSAGAKYTLHPFKRLRQEIYLRYQYPISSGGADGLGFNIHSKFGFDGSLGQIFEITNHLRLGIYWYGQWHEFKFNASNSAGTYSGEQRIFNSTFDLRLGVEY